MWGVPEDAAAGGPSPPSPVFSSWSGPPWTSSVLAGDPGPNLSGGSVLLEHPGPSGVREVQEADAPPEDEGELLGQQLVEAHAVVTVHPALAAPVVALRPAATERGRGEGLAAGMFWFCVENT